MASLLVSRNDAHDDDRWYADCVQPWWQSSNKLFRTPKLNQFLETNPLVSTQQICMAVKDSDTFHQLVTYGSSLNYEDWNTPKDGSLHIPSRILLFLLNRAFLAIALCGIAVVIVALYVHQYFPCWKETKASNYFFVMLMANGSLLQRRDLW